jgi:DNA primase
LVFPVYQGQQQVYFTTRYCGDDRLKSLHARNIDGFFTAKQCILNYDNLVGAPHVFLVEGPFDVMAFDHAGALFGKSASPVQVRLLEQLVRAGLQELTIALDSDALSEAYTLRTELSGVIPRVTVLELDEGDPWSRRDDLEDFISARQVPSLQSQLRSKMRFRLAGKV